MDILHAIRSLDPRLGGPVEVLRQTIAAHDRLGHVSVVACLDAPGDPWIADQPVAVHALGPGRGTYGFAAGFAPWLAEQHSRFDVVVVHGLWQYHGRAVWRGLADTTTPYAVGERESRTVGQVRIGVEHQVRTGWAFGLFGGWLDSSAEVGDSYHTFTAAGEVGFVY